jgi:hypothetical protein
MPLEYIKVRSLAGSSARGPVLAEWRDRDDRRGRVLPPQRRGIAILRSQLGRAAFDHDQIGGGERRRVAALAAKIEVFGERGRPVGIDAAHIRTDIGEEASGDSGGASMTNLNHPKAAQKHHRFAFPVNYWGDAGRVSKSAT